MNYLENVEHFVHPETHRQVSECSWLLVNFDGLQRMTMELPSGRQLFSLTANQAFAVLAPAGSHCEFAYGAARDNWVIKLRAGMVAESESGGMVLSWAGMTAGLSGFTGLDVLQVERCRDYLTRLLREVHTPDHDRSIALQLAFGGLLDCVTDPMLHPPEIDDPAKELRDRIIADRHFVRTLTDLSSRCGYTPDHLRTLFTARYGITPKAFRTDYRMRLARDLLALNTLSVGEIAEQLGYSNTPHFCTAFKNYFGHPPVRR